MVGQTILQREFDDASPVVIDDNQIRFNGIDEDGHETFMLLKNDTPREWAEDKDVVFNFCKTAEKPYDVYVTGVLFLAMQHLTTDIQVSSDGGVADWQAGVALVNEKLGKSYSMSGHDDIRTAIVEESMAV